MSVQTGGFMHTVTNVAAIVIAAMHIGFLVLEMFLWTRPVGLKVLHQRPADAETTKVLAANQGLYNGFLAAGLIWSTMAEPSTGLSLKLFFFSCVVIAGVFGAATASKAILFVQALPAAVALALTLTSVQ